MRFRRSGAALSCGRCGTAFAALVPLSLPTRGFVPFNLGFGGSLVVQHNIMMFRDARAVVLWQRVAGVILCCAGIVSHRATSLATPRCCCGVIERTKVCVHSRWLAFVSGCDYNYPPLYVVGQCWW